MEKNKIKILRNLERNFSVRKIHLELPKKKKHNFLLILSNTMLVNFSLKSMEFWLTNMKVILRKILKDQTLNLEIIKEKDGMLIITVK